MTRRETTPDEAMETVRGNHTRDRVVKANTGGVVHELGRDRYGTILLNTWVEAVRERRTMPVTEAQARRLITIAASRDTSGITLELIEYADSTLDVEREGGDDE